MLRASRRVVVRPSLLILSCLLCAPAFGVDWRLTKGVSADATITDNGRDASSGERAEAETVLGLSPFVALSATGQRHELTLDGRLKLTRFVDEDRTKLDPDASLRTRSILIDRFAELETVARVSQRAADGNPLTDDGFSVDSDREETWELGIAPSLETKLGERSRLGGEYRFTTVRNTDDAYVGSDTHAVAARLDTAIDSRGTFAFVVADRAQVRFEDGDSGRAATLGVGVGRPFGQTVKAAVSTGRDWAKASESSETLEDMFWAVALRWEPNEQVLATLGYGERVYGRKPSASLRLTGRRSSVELRWSRTLALAGGTVRGDALSAPFDEGGADVPLAERVEPVIDSGETLSPFADDASSVRERIDIGYSLKGRLSTLTASAGWFEEEQLGGSGDVMDEGVAGATSSSAASGSRGSEIALGFGRMLSKRVDVSSRYRSLRTRADDAARQVRSNVVEFVVSVRF